MTFTGFSWLTTGAQWQNHVNTAMSIQVPWKDRDFLLAFCIYKLLIKAATNGLVWTRYGLVFRRFLIRISDFILTDITSIRPRPLASKFSTIHHPLTNLTTKHNSFSHWQRRKTKLQKRRCSEDFTMKAYLEWGGGRFAPPQTLATAL